MYKLSAKAEEDIRNLLANSIEMFGVVQTEKYYESLKKCLETLATNPEIGINIECLRRGYLKFSHQSHVIYYKIFDNHILVVRMLHKAMDVTSKI